MNAGVHPMRNVRSVIVALAIGVAGTSQVGHAQAPPSPGVAVDADPHFYDGYDAQECLSAIRRNTRMLHRDRFDTARFTPRDTFPTLVRHTARACIAHLRVDAVDPRHLIALVQTGLAAGDDARVDAALARIVSAAPDDKARAEVLAKIIGSYLDIDMVLPRERLRVAFAQLDSVHGSAATVVKATTYALAGLWYFLLRADEDSVGNANLRAALRWSEQLDSAGKAEAGVMIGNAQAVSALMASLEMTGAGVAPPPVNGTLVAGPAGTYPKLGKFTLFVFQGGTDRQSAAAFRRLKAKFGDAIDIVFFGKSRGHFKLQGPLTFEDESKILAEYYTKELGVSGPVFIEHTEIHPRPDGKMITVPTANDRNYPDISISIIDGSGKLRASLPGFSGPAEIRLERALTQVLARSAATSPGRE